MNRIFTLAAMILMATIWLGCSSPMQQAQKMFNAGQYEELIAKFAANPELAGVVQQAKDKIAEKLLAEGKFQDVLTNYATSPAAREAKNKLAEQAFMAGNYQEVVMKYMDTPWGMQAKMKMDSIANVAAGGTPAKPGEPAKPGQPTKPGDTGAKAALEKEAQDALDKILAIKVPAAKTNMLAEFVKNPKWAGTKALEKAKAAQK